MAFLIIKWCTWFGYVWIIASVNESEEWNLSKCRKMDNIKCRRISDEALHVLFVSTVNLTTWQIFNIPFLSHILISQTALKLFHFGDYGESWFVPHCHARIKNFFLKDGREGGGGCPTVIWEGFFWGGGVKCSQITFLFKYMRKNFNRKNTSPTKIKGNIQKRCDSSFIPCLLDVIARQG